MQNNKLIIISACVIGVLIGFLIPAIKVIMDNGGAIIQPYEFVRAYLFNKGQYLGVILKLLVGMIGGLTLFGGLAILLVTRRNKHKLDSISNDFDLDSHYVISQRGRETIVMAIVLLAVAMVVLYTFYFMHTLTERTGLLDKPGIESTIGYPAIAFFTTLTLCVLLVSGALIAFYGSLNYGRYNQVPIDLNNDVLSFYKCFFGLPVIAIDKPVSMNLNHAEVDFKTQGGNGYLYVYNANARLVISPKLEFSNGSFDELADYVERFAVHEDE